MTFGRPINPRNRDLHAFKSAPKYESHDQISESLMIQEEEEAPKKTKKRGRKRVQKQEQKAKEESQAAIEEEEKEEKIDLGDSSGGEPSESQGKFHHKPNYKNVTVREIEVVPWIQKR